ncbi:MAG: hypothetical protein ACLRVU_09560 [Beduini sp.]|uniref:hypothetical protein n=1 Tax=Beduini sp. TaxID=1922300 RepID=UPI0039A2CC92
MTEKDLKRKQDQGKDIAKVLQSLKKKGYELNDYDMGFISGLLSSKQVVHKQT